jgi:hypothetical protein
MGLFPWAQSSPWHTASGRPRPSWVGPAIRPWQPTMQPGMLCVRSPPASVASTRGAVSLLMLHRQRTPGDKRCASVYKPRAPHCYTQSTKKGPEGGTGEGDQRGVNGSQSKFLKKTRPISQNQPDAPLF